MIIELNEADGHSNAAYRTNKRRGSSSPQSARPMAALLREIHTLFDQNLDPGLFISTSECLQGEMKQHLSMDHSQRMLPSFNYNLPTGEEQGEYLALEVGGSNLRMALVELKGRPIPGSSSNGMPMYIRRSQVFAIDSAVRQLRDHDFFHWMAAKIREFLPGPSYANRPLRMGVAWSFPLEQTSIRSGNVLGMGKGFCCSDVVKDHDLGDIITHACQLARSDASLDYALDIRLDAIVNDSSSALLARAYLDPTSRLAVILGTGVNAAIHLPIAALDASKFGSRTMSPDRDTAYVLTNTELSMFGQHILPMTRWDEHLNNSHMHPNYQPLEYFIAGGYMGEIVRLIICEATATAGLFNGSLPPGLANQYSLDTHTLASIEFANYRQTKGIIQDRFPSSQAPSRDDAHFITETVRMVVTRSTAYFAVSVHALATFLLDLRAEFGLSDDEQGHISIGCDGSVINKYPDFMARAQGSLNAMAFATKGRRIVLEKTEDSAVLGAAVAAALASGGIP